MSEQREVTVYDRVEAKALVSAKQIDRYLERTGWTRVTDGSGTVAAWWKNGEQPVTYVEVPLMESRRDWARRAAECVDDVASHENRQPSAVLSDIAKEQLVAPADPNDEDEESVYDAEAAGRMAGGSAR
jgi:hypothetical protein